MKRSIIRCLSLLSFVFLTNSWGHSQLTTNTLISTQDSHTNSRYPTKNYGSVTTMKSKTYLKRDVQYYTRSFVQFDLSSIPSNAIVYSASLNVNRTAAVTGGAKWNTKLITSSWVENTITASVQPTISTFSGDVVSTTPSTSSNLEKIDVTSMVQRMVYGQTANYGWSIQVEKEVYFGTSGAKFYTKEHATSSLRPKLIVNYYIPLSVAAATVTHESATSASDGGVSFTVNGGASSSYTYTWINGATGAQISSSTSPSPVALTGQPYGWYGLHISGGSFGEDLYQAFIIGKNCAEVDIEFVTSPEYTGNALVKNRIYTGIDQSNNNYSNHVEFSTKNWDQGEGWWGEKSYLDFHLWMDSELEIVQSDLWLKGWGHYSATTNASEIIKVTQDWNENYLTWNSSPTSSSSIQELIASTTSSQQDVTVDLNEFWEVWQLSNTTNYGILLQLQSFPDSYLTRMWYRSPSYIAVYQRPKINFKVRLIPETYLTSSWDVDNELGEVTADISEVCVKTPPYFYFVSNDTLPPLDSLYAFLNDTIIGIDSTLFYSITTTNLQKTYEDLAPGHYHFSAFDANGLRLFDQAVDIQGSINFDVQTGLSATGTEIYASQANAMGSLEYYTHEELNSSFTVELTGTSGIQFFGFVDIGQTVFKYQNIQYGFYLSGSNLYTIVYGVLSKSYVTVSSNSVLEIVNDKGALKWMLDGVQHNTKMAPATFEYKFGLELQPANNIKFKQRGNVSFKKKYRFGTNYINHISCGEENGSFSFWLTKTGSSQVCTVNYTITDPDGAIESGTVNTTASMPVSSLNGAPLVAGTYTISGTITGCAGGTIPFSETIDLGFEANWSFWDDYDLTPNSFSVQRATSNLGTYASARANNIMPYTKDGWISFEPKNDEENSANFLRFTTTDLDGPINSGIYNDAFVATVQWAGTNYLLTHDPLTLPNLNFQQLDPDAKVKLDFTTIGGLNDEVKIYIDEQYQSQLDIVRSTSNVLVRCQSLKHYPYVPGDVGFENVLTSFGCRASNNKFAHLKYELDGYYHIMKSGKIKFIFDQEYDTDDLSFEIYNSEDVLVKTDADFTAISATHGANYLTIDVSDTAHCIGEGFFYLKVINSKKEIMYLRFHNDFDDCN